MKEHSYNKQVQPIRTKQTPHASEESFWQLKRYIRSPLRYQRRYLIRLRINLYLSVDLPTGKFLYLIIKTICDSRARYTTCNAT